MMTDESETMKYGPSSINISTNKLQAEFELLQTEIYETLDWMIKSLEFTNQNTGMNAEDSPEMKAAKILRAKLKPERR